MLIEISNKELKGLKDQARQSERRRKNYNYHQDMNDPINRMVHAMNPDTYVQPHKHESPDKREVFLILEGRVAVVEFDSEGNIINHIILDRDTGNYGVEIPIGTWHCLIALENDSLVFEVKDGPYSVENDKNFADWAPKESSENKMECQKFLQDLKGKLSLSL